MKGFNIGEIKFFSDYHIKWVKVLGKFISLQLIIQFVTAICGILIIRILTKTEYAYFTIANLMQTSINSLAEMGIGSVITSIGARVWQDKYKFGQLMNTGISLRKYMMVIASVVTIPFTYLLLKDHGESEIYIIIIIVLIIIEQRIRLSTSYFSLAPLLHREITFIQTLDLLFSLSRLFFLAIAYLIHLNAVIAIATSVAASFLQAILMKRNASKKMDLGAGINSRYRTKMIGIVKGQIAYTIFFLLQAQITLFLISIFGNTESISNIGALGKVSVILTIIATIVSNFVSPKFAKTISVIELRKIYFKTIIVFLIICAIVISLSSVFPEVFLILLGNKYYSLTKELPLMIMSVMIQSLLGIIVTLNTSRTWITKSWLIIPFTLIIQILLILILDLSDIRSVIYFGAFSLLPSVFVNFYMSLKGLKII